MSASRCGNCGAYAGVPNWEARRTVIWANQYGQKLRVFCDKCGAWTDIREEWKTGKQTSLIVRKPTNER